MSLPVSVAGHEPPQDTPLTEPGVAERVSSRESPQNAPGSVSSGDARWTALVSEVREALNAAYDEVTGYTSCSGCAEARDLAGCWWDADAMRGVRHDEDCPLRPFDDALAALDGLEAQHREALQRIQELEGRDSLDAVAEGAFVTNREELFTRLCLMVPNGYVETEGEHGPGREYHHRTRDFLQAFWKFCDEKEGAGSGLSPQREPDE